MVILYSYLQKWKLKLTTTKTISTPSIFTRRHGVSLKPLSSAGLAFLCRTNLLRHEAGYGTPVSWIFGVTAQKENNCLCAFECLANLNWGASATVLRTTTLYLVFSTAEYCPSVWCRSANIYLIDIPIN